MDWKPPYKHSINSKFMNAEYLERYTKNYPEEFIREWCADPTHTEHNDSKWGNYSAPVQDEDFLTHIEETVLDDLKIKFLKRPLPHDHHYVNFHMDEPGSFLEPHNDLKNFRWLITSQVYLDNSNQGVRILDRELKQVKKVPNLPNTAYTICADPFSWHDVKELKALKRSILFRVGKRKHKTVAHYEPNEPCWIIINDNHDDTHYAKLGLRMGNLLEAWLHFSECKNIYHTDWRGDGQKLIDYAKEKHPDVNVVFSGEFPQLGEYWITQNNYEYTADVIFGKRKHGMLTDLENIMFDYYKNGHHLNYVDIV